MDIYERAAKIWTEGIVEPALLAERDQEAMEFQAECGRTGTPLTLVAEEAVDRTHRDLTSADYVGQQQPYDGFVGAR